MKTIVFSSQNEGFSRYFLLIPGCSLPKQHSFHGQSVLKLVQGLVVWNLNIGFDWVGKTGDPKHRAA